VAFMQGVVLARLSDLKEAGAEGRRDLYAKLAVSANFPNLSPSNYHAIYLGCQTTKSCPYYLPATCLWPYYHALSNSANLARFKAFLTSNIKPQTTGAGIDDFEELIQINIAGSTQEELLTWLDNRDVIISRRTLVRRLKL
jgi:hypothetical protein